MHFLCFRAENWIIFQTSKFIFYMYIYIIRFLDFPKSFPEVNFIKNPTK